MTRRCLLGVLSASLLSHGCGYHVGGKADMMPKTVQTIAIPAFATLSTQYRLPDMLAQDIGREFSSRSRFTVVHDPTEADAVLRGTINSTFVYPQIYDPGSGKATSVGVSVNLTVNLVERRTGKMLYQHGNWALNQNYQVAVDPHQFFDESNPALERLSANVAHDLVSSVLENF